MPTKASAASTPDNAACQTQNLSIRQDRIHQAEEYGQEDQRRCLRKCDPQPARLIDQAERNTGEEGNAGQCPAKHQRPRQQCQQVQGQPPQPRAPLFHLPDGVEGMLDGQHLQQGRQGQHKQADPGDLIGAMGELSEILDDHRTGFVRQQGGEQESFRARRKA